MTQSRSARHPLALFFLATLILALEAALYAIRWIFLLLLIGVGLSVLITPTMRLLKERLRVPKGISAALFLVIICGVIGAVVLLIYLLVAQQLAPLVEKLPVLIDAARAKTAAVFGRFPALRSGILSFEPGTGATSLAVTAARGFKIGASALGGFVFVLALAVYLAMSPDYYVESLLALAPAPARPGARRVLGHAAISLRHWFGAQLIAMLAVGTATGLGLWAIGVDYWPAFGALTAVLDIIPYIGPIISAAGALIVTAAADPGKVPWVIGLYVVMQQLEGHLVVPLVMKGRADLPPAHLMVAMLILGSWFGLLGLLVAPGLLAVARGAYGAFESASFSASSNGG